MSLEAYFQLTTAEKYVDFVSGQELSLPADSAFIKELCALPYPGDNSPESGQWVLDTASRAADLYQPRLLLLYIAMPLLLAMNTDIPRYHYLSRLRAGLESFFGRHDDYIPYIVGMGGVEPCLGLADEEPINGYVASSLWSYHYAGVFQAGKDAEKQLRKNDRLAMVQSREEFFAEHGITDADNTQHFPDFLLRAKPGYSFHGIGAHDRLPAKIPRQEKFLPVLCPENAPKDIHGIKPQIADILSQGKKIALVLLEGVGKEDIPVPCRQLSNRQGRYIYDHSINQYLAITTGRPVGTNPFPPVTDHRKLKEKQTSPYQTIFFSDLPDDCLGSLTRSLAVSSRCISGYVSSGSDITIECFCRNLQTLGTYAVFRKERGHEK